MALPVSNTIGSVKFTTDLLLGHAVRRCGVASAAVPEEVAEALSRIAYAWLSNLANRGIELWTVERAVVGIIPNTVRYKLPVGTVGLSDVVLYRTLSLTPSEPAGVIASGVLASAQGLFARDLSRLQSNLPVWTTGLGSAWVGYDFGVGAAVSPTTVAWIAPDTWPALEVQYSDNNTTWVPHYRPPGDRIPGNTQGRIFSPKSTWVVRDIPQPVVGHRYWRLISTLTDPITLNQVQFGFSPTEVQMGRLNRQEYQQQSVKRTPASRGVPNYWFDRTIETPELVLWPAPAYGFDQVVAWTTRHIMDPGDLTQQLEMPQRWWLATMTNLAEQVFHELPTALVDIKRYPIIKAEAEKRLAEAEGGEDDGAPFYLVPPIAAYTR